MGSWNSADHIAGDHIHTDIQRVALRNNSKSTALERSVIDYTRGLNIFYGIQILACLSAISTHHIIRRTTV